MGKIKLTKKEIKKRINENKVVKSLQKSIAQKDKQIFKEEKKIIEVLKDIKVRRIANAMGLENRILVLMCRSVVKMDDRRKELITERVYGQELLDKWIKAIEDLLKK